MASFASQAALRTHYEDLIDSTEIDLSGGIKNAVSWFKQVSINEKKIHIAQNIHN